MAYVGEAANLGVFVLRSGADLYETVLIHTQFTYPRTSAVLSHIKSRVEGVDAERTRLDVFGHQALSFLDEKIRSLHPIIRERILEGDDVINYFLSDAINNSRDGLLQEGGHYIDITYGRLPCGTLEENRKRGNIWGSGWYGEALEDPDIIEREGCGLLWTARLLLSDQKLPSQKEVVTLVRNKTISSETLQVYHDPAWPDVMDGIMFTYASLRLRRQLRKVPSVTQRHCEELASDAIENLLDANLDTETQACASIGSVLRVGKRDVMPLESRIYVPPPVDEAPDFQAEH